MRANNAITATTPLLLANPNAGAGRSLARLNGSAAMRDANLQVTASADEAVATIASQSPGTPVMLAGGDGTLQAIVDRLHRAHPGRPLPPFVMLGGGTMNVLASDSGFTDSVEQNAAYALAALSRGALRYRDVPLLKLSSGPVAHHGVTFGIGPMVRVVDAFYREGVKDKLGALATLGRALGAVFAPALFPGLRDTVAPLSATVTVDGQRLPFDQYSVLFINGTGRLFLGSRPFVGQRADDELYFAAYAASTAAVSATFPLLARGWRPDDPRYVNDTARRLVIETEEPIFTIDGEIFHSAGQPLVLERGSTIRVAERGPSR